MSCAATASSRVVGRRKGSPLESWTVEGESVAGEACVGGVEVEVEGGAVRRWRVVSDPRRSRSLAEGWVEEGRALEREEEEDFGWMERS